MTGLFHVCYWLARTYTLDPAKLPATGLAFNLEMLKPRLKTPPPAPSSMEAVAKLADELIAKDKALAEKQQESESLQQELEKTLRLLEEAKARNRSTSDIHDYGEALTRAYLIDQDLHNAGWPLTSGMIAIAAAAVTALRPHGPRVHRQSRAPRTPRTPHRAAPSCFVLCRSSLNCPFSCYVFTMSRIMNDFDDTTTALQVVEGLDLTGRRAVVTGASSGIGVETARALAQAGAQVTLAVRDMEAGTLVAADIKSTSGRDDVLVAHLDLADLTTVDTFTAAWQGPLHILINNAGVMDIPRSRTTQGWETHFGVNHLGHFALATGLHLALAEAGDARVVSVSSSGHAASPVVFDDLFFDRREYSPGLAYGQSKTANVLFAVEVTRRWATDGITANALMPGGIWTPLQRHWSAEQRATNEVNARQAEAAGLFRMKTVEQGAATSVFLATSPQVEGIGGRYFEDCHEAEVVNQLQGLTGVLPHALDPAAARLLWDVSEQLLTTARTTPTAAV